MPNGIIIGTNNIGQGGVCLGDNNTVGKNQYTVGKNNSENFKAANVYRLGESLLPNSNQTIVGRYNKQMSSTASFIVGVGTSNTDRKNGMWVTSNGNLVVGGPKISFNGNGSPTAFTADDLTNTANTATAAKEATETIKKTYLPLSGGTINGDLQISGTTKIDEFKIYKDNRYNICLDGTEVYSDVIVKLHEPAVGPEKNFSFAINDNNTNDAESGNLFSVSRENCTISSESIYINASNASRGVNFGCGNNGYFYMNENKIGWDGANDTWSISGIQFSTEDLVAGTSSLTTDRIYIVYE